MDAFELEYDFVQLFSGGIKYTEVGKIGDFLRKSPFISETVRDRPMVIMEL